MIYARVETRRFSAIDEQISNPVFHLIGARVETKRLSAVKKSFKPVFQLIVGARVETTWVPGALQLRALVGQGETTRTATLKPVCCHLIGARVGMNPTSAFQLRTLQGEGESVNVRTAPHRGGSGGSAAATAAWT